MSQSCLLQILFVCCFYYWIFCNFCPNFILVQYHHLFTKCLKKTNSRVSVSRLFPVVSCLPSSLILDTENSLYQIGFESINGSIHAKTSHWMVPGRCTIQYLLKPSRSFPDCNGRIVSSFWANIPNPLWHWCAKGIGKRPPLGVTWSHALSPNYIITSETSESPFKPPHSMSVLIIILKIVSGHRNAKCNDMNKSSTLIQSFLHSFIWKDVG